MSEVRREFYASEMTNETVTLSPAAGLDNHPAAPPLNQLTVSTQTKYSPCELWTAVTTCARYEVIIRRKT